MGERMPDHGEKKPDERVVPSQEVQDRAPDHQPPSLAAALQRAKRAPAAPSPTDIWALQRAVGNQAVQRLVDPHEGTVQRQIGDVMGDWGERMRAQLNALHQKVMLDRQEEDVQWQTTADAFHEQYPKESGEASE